MLVSQIGAATYDVQLLGGDYLCAGLSAEGPLVGLNVSFSFDRFGDTEAWPSDMFMLMQTVDENGIVVDCYQYGGYDTNVFFYCFPLLYVYIFLPFFKSYLGPGMSDYRGVAELLANRHFGHL